jgi:hypothetical protein
VFVVARETDSQPWTLRFVELDPLGENAKRLQAQTFLPRYVAPTSAILLGTAIEQQRMPSSLINDAKFQIAKIERLTDGEVRVHYQLGSLIGELDCDPTANYLIKRGRSRQNGKRLNTEMTFERHLIAPVPGAKPRVDRLVLEITDVPGGKRTDETHYS